MLRLIQGESVMISSHATPSKDYNKIRDDLYSNKPLDLTPMLNAIRQRDKQALTNLFSLGFKLKWIDQARKKSVVRILTEEGDIYAIRFLFDFLSHDEGRSIIPDAVQGAMLGEHNELLEFLKHRYPYLSSIDHHVRVAHALTGNLPWNRDIEEYLTTSSGSVYFAEIIYYLSLNGQTKTAIKLIDDFVTFKLSSMDYFIRTYSSFAKESILKDLIMKHPIIYDYLIKGAMYDDEFKMDDVYHLRRNQFIPAHDREAAQCCHDELNQQLAKAIASTGRSHQYLKDYCDIGESTFNSAIEGAIEMGHFHFALELCDQARQLNDVDAYFRVLINATRCAIHSRNTVLVKLILRRFPDDFKFDFNHNAAKLTCTNRYSSYELLKYLHNDIKDPAAYLLALYVYNPAEMYDIVSNYQSLLGIPPNRQLNASELRSLFSNRSLISFILSGIQKRYPLAFNHDIHEKLMADISEHKLKPDHLKLLKEVAINNKQLFCHTIARKKIPEPCGRFAEYLRIYNKVRNHLLFYINNRKGYHSQKAEMLIAELNKTVNIAEIQSLLHRAANTFSYYSFYEFTFARLLPNDLEPILRECIKFADSEPGFKLKLM